MTDTVDLSRERRLRALDARTREALAMVDTGRTLAMLAGEIPCPDLDGDTNMGRPKTRTADAARLAIRIEPDLLARLDAELERMRAAQPGVSLTRSDAMRVAMLRGLEALAAERERQ